MGTRKKSRRTMVMVRGTSESRRRGSRKEMWFDTTTVPRVAAQLAALGSDEAARGTSSPSSQKNPRE